MLGLLKCGRRMPIKHHPDGIPPCCLVFMAIPAREIGVANDLYDMMHEWWDGPCRAVFFFFFSGPSPRVLIFA